MLKHFASSSSTQTAITHHRYLRFDHPTHKESYYHLKDRSSGLGQCIYWEAFQIVGLFSLVHTQLDVTPWERFFAIVESIYIDLTLEFCSIFFLQTVLLLKDNPRAISVHLRDVTQYLSIVGFGLLSTFILMISWLHSSSPPSRGSSIDWPLSTCLTYLRLSFCTTRVSPRVSAYLRPCATFMPF